MTPQPMQTTSRRQTTRSSHFDLEFGCTQGSIPTSFAQAAGGSVAMCCKTSTGLTLLPSKRTTPTATLATMASSFSAFAPSTSERRWTWLT